MLVLVPYWRGNGSKLSLQVLKQTHLECDLEDKVWNFAFVSRGIQQKVHLQTVFVAFEVLAGSSDIPFQLVIQLKI